MAISFDIFFNLLVKSTLDAKYHEILKVPLDKPKTPTKNNLFIIAKTQGCMCSLKKKCRAE